MFTETCIPFQSTDNAFSYLFNKKPEKTYWIMKRINRKSNASCRTAILRLCEITMSRSQRSRFRGTSDGVTWDREMLVEEACLQDEDYTKAGILRVYDYPCHRRQRMLLRNWYKLTEEGQRLQVDALYKVISSNPMAFLEFLKPALKTTGVIRDQSSQSWSDCVTWITDSENTLERLMDPLPYNWC